MIQSEADVQVLALIVVNFFGVFLGTLITGLSYYAYKSSEQKTSLRNATAGFGLITLGIAFEPAYQLGIKGTHILVSGQNIILQIIEGSLISMGFLALFFSIYRYRSTTERRRITVNSVDDDFFDGSE